MILRFDPKTSKTTVFTNKACKSNGLAFDLEGNLLSCDGADGGGRCVRRWNLKTGQSEVVADRFQGKRLNSPNDLCVDLKGRIYFTDPRYGGTEPRELDREAVYRIEKDGTVIEDHTTTWRSRTASPSAPTSKRFTWPTTTTAATACLRSDPEPKRGAMKVYAFPLDEDGLVNGERKTLVDFGKENGCDGMRVDTQGNLYLAIRSLARPGIMVIDSDGKELAFLADRADQPKRTLRGLEGHSRATWSSASATKQHSLYVTIDKSLYRIRLKTRGFHPQQAGK